MKELVLNLDAFKKYPNTIDYRFEIESQLKKDNPDFLFVGIDDDQDPNYCFWRSTFKVEQYLDQQWQNQALYDSHPHGFEIGLDRDYDIDGFNDYAETKDIKIIFKD
ncbi:hypothetical protein [Sulfurimonas sp.]|uniref:hypothetical protein n=1 Tax=Sulfurimonas sp. TaxID=2022749 RepID=UPI003D152036